MYHSYVCYAFQQVSGKAFISTGIVFSLFNLLTVLISRAVLIWFPANTFNVLASIVLFLINTIYTIVQMWKGHSSYNFWVVIELLFLTSFIYKANYIVVMKEDRKRG